MTHFDWLLAIGLFSAALGTLAFLPYIRDMIWGRTRPLRATWLIWSVLSMISFFSNVQEGASASLVYVAVQAGFTSVIFLLSLKHGTGGLLRLADLQVLATAGFGLWLWYSTDNAAYALTISIIVSALGGAVTILKTYRAPGSETVSCWLLSAIAAAGGAVAVGTWDPVLLAYPLYLLVLYSGILIAIWLGRLREAANRPVPVPLLLPAKVRADVARFRKAA